jgi:hypothetical protein
MARILGWVITDGGIHDRRNKNQRVVIDQSLNTTKRGHKLARMMDKILMAIPGVTRYKRPARSSMAVGRIANCGPSYRWYLGGTSSEEVLRWLGDEVHRIPRDLIENCSKEQLEQLYLGLMEGDGTSIRGRWSTFFPGLERGLADDFQEVSLRLGICTSGSSVTPHGCNQQFLVYVASMSDDHYVRKIAKKHYSGTIWNVSVPTGAFVARRNGRPFVVGGLPKVTHRATIEPLSFKMFQGRKSPRKTAKAYAIAELESHKAS